MISDLEAIWFFVYDILILVEHIQEVKFKKHFDIIDIGIFFLPGFLKDRVTETVRIRFLFSFISYDVSHSVGVGCT